MPYIGLAGYTGTLSVTIRCIIPTSYNTVMFECIYIVMIVCVDNILLQHPLHTGNITQFAHGRLTDHIYASTIYVCIYIYIQKENWGLYVQT